MTKKPEPKKTKTVKKTKSKPMRKNILIIISIIILICIIGFIWLSLSPSVVKAQLIIESGTVQVKHADGAWNSAENGMILYQSDSVKTGNDTAASIILFESSIIRLDSNTEVLLQEIIEQAGGHIVGDTCMVVSPIEHMGYKTTGVNSGKAANYLPGFCKQQVVFANIDALVEAQT